MIKTSSQGYIALVGVLLLGSALLVALLTLSLNIGSGSKLIQSQIKGEKAYFLASTCAEDALEKLYEDSHYDGNEVLAFDQGICGILPLENVSGAKIIKTYGNFEEYTRRLKIEITTTTPQIIISEWQEVADF